MNDNTAPPSGITLDDFYCILPRFKFLFVPTGALWPRISVDARLPPVPDVDEDGKAITIPASTWLCRHRGLLSLPPRKRGAA